MTGFSVLVKEAAGDPPPLDMDAVRARAARRRCTRLVTWIAATAAVVAAGVPAVDLLVPAGHGVRRVSTVGPDRPDAATGGTTTTTALGSHVPTPNPGGAGAAAAGGAGTAGGPARPAPTAAVTTAEGPAELPRMGWCRATVTQTCDFIADAALGSSTAAIRWQVTVIRGGVAKTYDQSSTDPKQPGCMEDYIQPGDEVHAVVNEIRPDDPNGFALTLEPNVDCQPYVYVPATGTGVGR